MNGFDVVRILEHTHMYNKDSRGLILNDRELISFLSARGLLVSDNTESFKWDYVYVQGKNLSLQEYVSLLSFVDVGGIIIIDMMGEEWSRLEEVTRTAIGNLKFVKQFFDGRKYLVGFTGDEYGN